MAYSKKRRLSNATPETWTIKTRRLLPTVHDETGSKAFEHGTPCLATFASETSFCAHHIPNGDPTRKRRRSRHGLGSTSSKRQKVPGNFWKPTQDVNEDTPRLGRKARAGQLLGNHDVYEHLLRFLDGATLRSCTLLSRYLHSAAHRQLFRHMRISNMQLRYLHFVGEMPSSILDKMVHLTIQVSSSGWLLSKGEYQDPQFLPFDCAREADKCLNAFAQYLPFAKALKSFSFSIDRQDFPHADFVITQTTLANLVRALPPSCIALELDTQGMDDAGMATEDSKGRQIRRNAEIYEGLRNYLRQDSRRSEKERGLFDYDNPWDNPDPHPGPNDIYGGAQVSIFDHESCKSLHLCDEIRKKLPQLQHVRLRLRSMCNQLFISGQNSDYDPLPTDVHPKLRTFIINDAIHAAHWPSGKLMEKPILKHGFTDGSARLYAHLCSFANSGRLPNAHTLRHISFHRTGNIEDVEALVELNRDFTPPDELSCHCYGVANLRSGLLVMCPSARSTRSASACLTDHVREHHSFLHGGGSRRESVCQSSQLRLKRMR